MLYYFRKCMGLILLNGADVAPTTEIQPPSMVITVGKQIV
jgi:hypothetical protein